MRSFNKLRTTPNTIAAANSYAVIATGNDAMATCIAAEAGLFWICVVETECAEGMDFVCAM